MHTLELKKIAVRYDGKDPVVAGASLAVATGDFVVLTGRSGCGKTSLLNVAAGFISPDSGQAAVDGIEISAPGADRAVVFQNDALFPWFTARDNVSFALRMRGVPKRERDGRADALLERVGLSSAGSKHIWELSGGMRQRLGLARALAADPDFLLMDEPLGALDALMRERMQTLLLDIWATSKVGILMVTHGIEEALAVATRIIVMAPGPGRIVQSLDTDFARRYVAGETLRSIKADAEFVAARAALTDAIFAEEVV